MVESKDNSTEHKKKRRKSRAAKKSGSRKSKKTDTAQSDDLDPRFVSKTGQIIGGRYLCRNRLGKGGDAVVYRGIDQETEHVVAIKQIPLDEKTNKDELLKEIEFMKQAEHPNIVRYYNHLEEDGNLFLIIEFMENGSLTRIVKQRGGMPEDLISMYMEQVLRGLAYLHDQGVAHRDIKGDNLLTTSDSMIKLADFGIAINVEAYVRPDNTLDASVVGTPYWMGPEVIQIKNPTVKSDIWAVGCTIVELLTGSPPYYDLGSMAAMFRIVEDEEVPLPPKISNHLKDFLRKCFEREPEKRPSAKELLNHKWIQNKGMGTIAALPDLQGVSDFIADINGTKDNDNNNENNENNNNDDDGDNDEDEDDDGDNNDEDDGDNDNDNDNEANESGTISESVEDSTDKITTPKAVSFSTNTEEEEKEKESTSNKIIESKENEKKEEENTIKNESTMKTTSQESNKTETETENNKNNNNNNNNNDNDNDDDDENDFGSDRKAFLEYIANLSHNELRTKKNGTLIKMVIALRDELQDTKEDAESMENELTDLRARQNSLMGKILFKLTCQ